MAENSMNEIDIQRKAIELLINNEWESCSEVLKDYKDKSPLLSVSFGLLSYCKAVISLEERDALKASKDLDKAQKICKEYIKTISSNSSKQSNSKSTAKKMDPNDLFNKLNTEILIADCKFSIALLTILRQDLSGILTTGVFELRRAWKIYSALQKTLYSLFKQYDPNAESIYGINPDEAADAIKIDDTNDAEDQEDMPDSLNEMSNGNATSLTQFQTDAVLPLEKVKQLLASVSYGYGIVQLCFSFIPPNILKLLKFIGFEGDRTAAFKALNFASESTDFRAVFADTMILVYSTMGRQIIGQNENDFYFDENRILHILQRNLRKYPTSCLFLYKKAKYHEIIEKNLNDAYKCLEIAIEHTFGVTEIECIIIYEMGFINLLNLNIQKALECFTQFSKDSKWSVSFNSLIFIILNGCLGNFDILNAFYKTLPKSTQKTNALEIYASKRLEFLKKLQVCSKPFYEFLLIEYIFLVGYIPYVKHEILNEMLKIMDQQTDKGFYSSKCLIEGAIYLELNNKDNAEQLFRESIARDDKQYTIAKYVKPFAYFLLSRFYLNANNLSLAQECFNKAKSFKDFDSEDRWQVQMRSYQRFLEYKTNSAKK